MLSWDVKSSKKRSSECSKKQKFIKISQNLQENTCTRISFVMKLQVEACKFIKSRLWDWCLTVNLAKLLRTSFLQKTSGRLLLIFSKLIFWKSQTTYNDLKLWLDIFLLIKEIFTLSQFKIIILMTRLKGTLMQIWKSPYMSLFI